MLDKLSAIKDRFVYLGESLADPSVIADLGRYKSVNKEYKDLQELVLAINHYEKVNAELNSARSLLSDPDPSIRQMAEEEITLLQVNQEGLEQNLRTLLLPKDPDDGKDVLLEIRSGTGGDEASLFVGDIIRMYTRFFDRMGYKYEVLSQSDGTIGGYNKIVLEVSGSNVFGTLKFESGAHRVQRVPKTESQGRVHTSAITVAVMPKFEEEEINLNKSDSS